MSSLKLTVYRALEKSFESLWKARIDFRFFINKTFGFQFYLTSMCLFLILWYGKRTYLGPFLLQIMKILCEVLWCMTEKNSYSCCYGIFLHYGECLWACWNPELHLQQGTVKSLLTPFSISLIKRGGGKEIHWSLPRKPLLFCMYPYVSFLSLLSHWLRFSSQACVLIQHPHTVLQMKPGEVH